MKRIYIASYHQSKFGKLMGMTVPQILNNAIEGACREIGAEASALDVGSVAATCNIPLNEQGLLAGLMAETPGMEAKPIEAVENACASGGQAVLSVVQKLLLGMGDTGIAVGFEKMRDAEGKMDGKLIGKVLGYFSHPDERAGKVFVFPHIFAEVMRDYMAAYGVTERDLAAIPVQEYANAKYNSCAQMQKVQITLDQAVDHRRHQPLRCGGTAAQDVRLLPDHRRLRRPDSGDRRRPGEARAVEVRLRGSRRMRAGDRPPSQERPRRAAPQRRLPCDADRL